MVLDRLLRSPGCETGDGGIDGQCESSETKANSRSRRVGSNSKDNRNQYEHAHSEQCTRPEDHRGKEGMQAKSEHDFPFPKAGGMKEVGPVERGQDVDTGSHRNH